MLFSSSNTYSIHLLDLLYSCKNWMDLRAKTLQKNEKYFQVYLFHLNKKKKIFAIGCWMLYCKEAERRKLGTITSTKKKGGVHSKACYLFTLYTASSFLWISKPLSITEDQAIFFPFDKWHTGKLFAINSSWTMKLLHWLFFIPT